MGRVDQVTSDLYSFGIRGKQFRYIEGKLPEGFPSHGRMTDDDVRNLQDRGAKVIVLESHYTSGDLKQARADCLGEAGKTPNQAEPKAPPTQAPGAIASTPTLILKADDSASSMGTTEGALIDVSSTPTGADLYIDEHFFGRTPSTILLDREITGSQSRRVDSLSGRKSLKIGRAHVGVDAELVPKAK